MNQMTLTSAERVAALQHLGYTDREAQFLCLAALHGGYFLRRQCARFLGTENGGMVTQLVQKALQFEHARASTWRQNTQLYHLCARPFYEAIGQSDNRNRRTREICTIKTKVMGLDFVLAHVEREYLATDSEKLDYFVRQLQIDLGDLPVAHYRAASSGEVSPRYFVEKFPIFLATQLPPSPLLISFAFVDEGRKGLTAFESFLERYKRLFGALNSFQLIYVADSSTHFEAAKNRFERQLSGASGNSQKKTISPESLPRLLEYFELRRGSETGGFAGFNREKLIALRDARNAFSGREYEQLYTFWKAAGTESLTQFAARQHTAQPLRGTLSTYLLEHDYGLFSTVRAA